MAEAADKSELNESGIIGLNGIGRNPLLNIAGDGFSVAGYDNNKSKVAALLKESKGKNIHGTDNTKELISKLRKPRVIMMLVPMGPEATQELLAHQKNPGWKACDLFRITDF